MGKHRYWKRAILLVDMNAFFAQVEQRHNPRLRNKPVLVGGNTESLRTVVAAASYEAKAFGIQSGMALYEAKSLCPEAILVEGNPDKYLHYCHALAEIYRTFTDLVEVYSIDEAFLDVTGVQKLFGPPEVIALKIKERLRKTFHMTCSIGIAPNKLMAKMASNRQKPDGLTVFYPEEIPQVMWPLPVEELFGVGHRMKAHLEKMGIHTIGDLALCPEDVLRSKFGLYGALLHQWANGIDPTPVDPANSVPTRSMGHSYTLPEDTEDPHVIKWFLFYLSDRVARRLRQANFSGRTVTLVVRTGNYATFTRSRTLPEPLFLPQEIARHAFQLFLEHFSGESVRLVGVSVSSLQPLLPQQPSLFLRREKLKKLMTAYDRIKDKYGENALTFLSLTEPANRKRLLKKVGAFCTKEQKNIRPRFA